MLVITVLGTGGAVPTPRRWLPSVLVEDRKGRRILLDVGEGAQYRLMEIGVSPSSLDIIAITHFHGDHLFGLPGLLSTMKMGSRKRDLVLVGPPGIEEVAGGLARYVGAEFAVRAHVGGFREGDLEVQCVEAVHTSYSCSYVLRWDLGPGRLKPERARELGVPVTLLKELKLGRPVEVVGREVLPEDVLEPRADRHLTLVYSGDTAPNEKLLGLGKVDILIHEATFADDVARQDAHREGHSTVLDVVDIVDKLRPRVAVLVHFSSRYRDLERYVRHVRGRNVVVPEDLDQIVYLVD